MTCRKWDNPLDPVGNHPPEPPSHPSPTDSGVGSDAGLVLSWQSVDPDSGDTVYFDVFLGPDTNPGLVGVRLNQTVLRPAGVACSTQYYWRVIAYDNHDDSAVGPRWWFETVAALAVAAPDTGEQLEMYATDTIAWTGGPMAMVRADGMSLSPGGHALPDSTVVFRSTDDGVSWIRLGRAAEPGRFVWEVPGPATESARVRVLAWSSGDTVSGTSGRFAVHDTL